MSPMLMLTFVISVKHKVQKGLMGMFVVLQVFAPKSKNLINMRSHQVATLASASTAV